MNKNLKLRLDNNSSTIFLRYLTIEDVCDEYVRWLNDMEINRFLESRFERQTLQSIKVFVEACLKDESAHLFAICDRETSKHIGNIKLGGVNPHHKYGEIGLFIGDRSFWGKGLGACAIELISNFGFDSLKLHKISAECYECNISSYKSFLKAGFCHESTKKDQYKFNGQWVSGQVLTRFSESMRS